MSGLDCFGTRVEGRSENGTTTLTLKLISFIIADKGGREGRCIAGTSAELSAE